MNTGDSEAPARKRPRGPNQATLLRSENLTFVDAPELVPSASTKGKQKSACWNYFRVQRQHPPPPDGQAVLQVVCLCGAVYRWGSNFGTKNMNEHPDSARGGRSGGEAGPSGSSPAAPAPRASAPARMRQPAANRQSAAPRQGAAADGANPGLVLNPRLLRSGLARFVVQEPAGVDLAGTPHLNELLLLAGGVQAVGDIRSLRSLLFKEYSNQVAGLKAVLKHRDSGPFAGASLVATLWSGRRWVRPLLCLFVCWIDRRGLRRRCLLDVRPLASPLTGERVRSVILTCLDEWGLSDSVHCLLSEDLGRMASQPPAHCRRRRPGARALTRGGAGRGGADPAVPAGPGAGGGGVGRRERRGRRGDGGPGLDDGLQPAGGEARPAPLPHPRPAPPRPPPGRAGVERGAGRAGGPVREIAAPRGMAARWAPRVCKSALLDDAIRKAIGACWQARDTLGRVRRFLRTLRRTPRLLEILEDSSPDLLRAVMDCPTAWHHAFLMAQRVLQLRQQLARFAGEAEAAGFADATARSLRTLAPRLVHMLPLGDEWDGLAECVRPAHELGERFRSPACTPADAQVGVWRAIELTEETARSLRTAGARALGDELILALRRALYDAADEDLACVALHPCYRKKHLRKRDIVLAARAQKLLEALVDELSPPNQMAPGLAPPGAPLLGPHAPVAGIALPAPMPGMMPAPLFYPAFSTYPIVQQPQLPQPYPHPGVRVGGRGPRGPRAPGGGEGSSSDEGEAAATPARYELERFFSEKREQVNRAAMDPVQWWVQAGAPQYPTLLRAALRHMGAPVSSAFARTFLAAAAPGLDSEACRGDWELARALLFLRSAFESGGAPFEATRRATARRAQGAPAPDEASDGEGPAPGPGPAPEASAEAGLGGALPAPSFGGGGVEGEAGAEVEAEAGAEAGSPGSSQGAHDEAAGGDGLALM
eukprot:tig00021348_g20509.t1